MQDCLNQYNITMTVNLTDRHLRKPVKSLRCSSCSWELHEKMLGKKNTVMLCQLPVATDLILHILYCMNLDFHYSGRRYTTNKVKHKVA